MSRQLKRIGGSGTGGAYNTGDFFKQTTSIAPLKDDVDLWLSGVVQRNIYAGGDQTLELDGSASGNFDVKPWVPILIDNTGSQISNFSDTNGATLVVKMRYLIRVSNAGINVTPRVLRGATIPTVTTVATISGQSACSALNTDFSGVGQVQDVVLSLPAAAHYFKPGYTIGGTPAAGYFLTVQVTYDCYIQLP